MDYFAQVNAAKLCRETLNIIQKSFLQVRIKLSLTSHQDVCFALEKKGKEIGSFLLRKILNLGKHSP